MLSLLDIFFPKKCVGCKRVGNYFCSKCILTITQKNLVCIYCKEESFAGLTHPLLCQKSNIDGVWSLGSYEGVLKKAIQYLKYKLIFDLGKEMIELMVIYLNLKQPYFWDQIKKNQHQWVVVPVPLHQFKMNKRGFNQSAVLAKILAEKLGLNYADILIRTRNTPQQVGLSSFQRKKNMINAFSLKSSVINYQSNVLLVDDVWTTGSTLKECAKVLKSTGIDKIWAVTIAH